MAPLNKEEVENRHIVTEELGKRRHSWFSLFFHSYYVHQRKNFAVQNAKTDASVVNHEMIDNVEHIASNNGTHKCCNSVIDKTENDVKGAEKDTSVCSNCKLEQDSHKDTKQFIYRKRNIDSISKEGSICSALMNFSPQWFKSLMKDPEYVMTGGKKAEHNE